MTAQTENKHCVASDQSIGDAISKGFFIILVLFLIWGCCFSCKIKEIEYAKKKLHCIVWAINHDNIR